MGEAEQQLLHEFRHTTAMDSIEIPVGEDSRAHTRSTSSSSADTASPTKKSFLVIPMDDALKSSIERGKFSDLIVVHGAERWTAHKLILASHSSILDTMITNLEDGADLNLNGYHPEAVRAMMDFLYSGSYTTTSTDIHLCILLHTKVYSLASELHIEGLKDLSCRLFTDTLQNQVSDIEMYLEAVKTVYAYAGGEHSALRFTVLSFGVTGIHVFLQDNEVWKRFAHLMSEVPAFQRDVILALTEIPVDSDGDNMRLLCKDCGPMDPDDLYQVTVTCKGCGVDKTAIFR